MPYAAEAYREKNESFLNSWQMSPPVCQYHVHPDDDISQQGAYGGEPVTGGSQAGQRSHCAAGQVKEQCGEKWTGCHGNIKWWKYTKQLNAYVWNPSAHCCVGRVGGVPSQQVRLEVVETLSGSETHIGSTTWILKQASYCAWPFWTHYVLFMPRVISAYEECPSITIRFRGKLSFLEEASLVRFDIYCFTSKMFSSVTNFSLLKLILSELTLHFEAVRLDHRILPLSLLAKPEIFNAMLGDQCLSQIACTVTVSGKA